MIAERIQLIQPRRCRDIQSVLVDTHRRREILALRRGAAGGRRRRRIDAQLRNVIHNQLARGQIRQREAERGTAAGAAASVQVHEAFARGEPEFGVLYQSQISVTEL